ncbi:hypothetical protein D9M69_709910 [compost metagenome]
MSFFEALSCMERRRKTTTIALSAPIKKGMRQPHSVSSSLLKACCRVTTVSSARICPAIMVKYWKEPKKPRRPAVAISLM